MSPQPNLSQATGINLVANAATRALNFLGLSVLVAYYFGASRDTDAYVMASVIPVWLTSVLLYSLNGAFIPVFTEYLSNYDEDEAWEVVFTIGAALVSGLGLIATIGIVAAPVIIPTYAPGFGPGEIQLTVSLARWIFTSLIITGIANFLASIFYAYNEFAIPGVARVLSPMIIVLALVTLHRSLGIYSLVVGLILGAAVQTCWQALYAWRGGFLPSKASVNFRHKGLAQTGRLLLPIFMGSAIYPVYILIARALASQLPEGSVAGLDFATKMVEGSSFVFISAVTTSILPTLCKYAAYQNDEDFKRVMEWGTRKLALILIPLGIALLTMSIPVVHLVLERGAFDAQDTQTTAQALRFLALGIFVQTFGLIFIQAFFALQDTYRLLLGGTTGLIVSVISAILLVDPLGIGGLALSVPLGYLAQMLVLGGVLNRRLGGLFHNELWGFVTKIAIAAACMGFVVSRLPAYLASQVLDGGGLSQLLSFIFSASLGGFTYFALIWLMGVEEAKNLWNGLHHRLGLYIQTLREVYKGSI